MVMLMSKKKTPEEKSIRSSAAEYLTYIAATGDNPQSVEMRYEDENIWLTQKMLATLYDVEVPTINEHIAKVYSDHELESEATIRNFRIVQTEGLREITREVKHYNLQMIIAIGFKINSDRAVQFRKWINKIAKDYTIQGWVMDDERLKNGGSALTEKYYDKLLEKIREIRLSERRFYQKVADIYATALDYDKNAKTTHEFFAKVQNKMHFAVHGQTAAEVIYNRADAKKEHMGLTIWDDAPDGKIQRYDVSVAKNYLSRDELSSLERIVSAYLDLAEDRARAAMRVSACGFVAKTIDDAKLLSHKVTEVTHNHTEGIKGAEATAVCIVLAREGQNILEIRDYVNEYYYPMNFTLDGIRDNYKFNETCQDTVPQAIMAFLESSGNTAKILD